MTELEKAIEEARTMVSESGTRPIDSYYGKIRALYQSSSGETQRWLMGRLESLAYRLEEKHTIHQNPFDPKRAMRIRKEAKFTRAELAVQIQTSLKTIQRWEYNEGGPGNFKHNPSEKALVYLNWLKERGYNPFNL